MPWVFIICHFSERAEMSLFDIWMCQNFWSRQSSIMRSTLSLNCHKHLSIFTFWPFSLVFFLNKSHQKAMDMDRFCFLKVSPYMTLEVITTSSLSTCNKTEIRHRLFIFDQISDKFALKFFLIVMQLKVVLLQNATQYRSMQIKWNNKAITLN